MSKTLAETYIRLARDAREQAIFNGAQARTYIEVALFPGPCGQDFADLARFFTIYAVRYARESMVNQVLAEELQAIQAKAGKCWRWGQPNEPLWEQCLLPEEHVGPCVTSQGPTLPVYR